MDRRELSRILLTTLGAGGLGPAAAGASPTSSPAAQRGSSLPPRASPAETRAGIAAQNPAYPPGHLRRYGAVGDGSTDDTEALDRGIAVLNAGQGLLCGEPGDVYLCAPLASITADAAIIEGRGLTIKARADSWPDHGDGATHVHLAGHGIRVTGLTLDGNQASFSRDPHTGRLLQFGDRTLLLDVTVRNSACQGARTGGNGGLCVGCHFDDNVNLGSEINAAADIAFVACTWNRNGYGFHRSIRDNAFAAFGLAIRYRSHDLRFDGCEASYNGREGFAVGQGSYACRFIGCLAHMNGDGGFTIHADTIGVQAAGDGEGCHGLEFVACESSNNYGSGLVAFAAVRAVNVQGGRYYNNHRLAGELPFASSYPNGIYFAAGSRDILVNTRAYDDRQHCRIDAAGEAGDPGRILAGEWRAGLREQYPKVAFYDDSGAFRGYARIDQEDSGVLLVHELPHDGVKLATVRPGWHVAQRVQHNGCFLDNDCTGQLIVHGTAMLPGPKPYTGWKCISGSYRDGQNVLLPQAILDPANELISNPGFDRDLQQWTFSSAPGSAAQQHRGIRRRSRAALALTGGSALPATADAQLEADALSVLAGAFVECSVWCYAGREGEAGLQLFWDLGQGVRHSTATHPGGGWKFLVIGAFIPPTAVRVYPRLYTAAGRSCYFDNASLRVRCEPA